MFLLLDLILTHVQNGCPSRYTHAKTHVKAAHENILACLETDCTSRRFTAIDVSWTIVIELAAGSGALNGKGSWTADLVLPWTECLFDVYIR